VAQFRERDTAASITSRILSISDDLSSTTVAPAARDSSRMSSPKDVITTTGRSASSSFDLTAAIKSNPFSQAPRSQNAQEHGKAQRCGLSHARLFPANTEPDRRPAFALGHFCTSLKLWDISGHCSPRPKRRNALHPTPLLRRSNCPPVIVGPMAEEAPVVT